MFYNLQQTLRVSHMALEIIPSILYTESIKQFQLVIDSRLTARPCNIRIAPVVAGSEHICEEKILWLKLCKAFPFNCNPSTVLLPILAV